MLARRNPRMAFTSLNHYVDYEWVKYAYECTRKDGAVGVDGATAEDYAANLEQNLLSLIGRLKSGRYQAPPVRRHYIPKSDGGQRGLGIPCFEDKVAQRAIVMLLEPIYEQDFQDCSFGFRPGRNAHQALRVIWSTIMGWGGRWVLDVDVRKYFDSIPFTPLRECLARRVTDGVVRRMIDKWLKAGVLEEGQLFYPETGTPQGGVLSPLLANVYLHYVLDEWFTAQVQPRLAEASTLVRYCDDFVMLFADKADAERVLAVLGKRLGKYGLQLHPDKTRLVDFRFKPAAQHCSGERAGATTFNFLGFTHVWGRSRKGKPVVLQLTAKDRFARALKAINRQCRSMRHWPLREQHHRLCQMLKGHFTYFGVIGNYQRLAELSYQAQRCWRKWLSRRSRQSRVSWAAFQRILESLPLPAPKVIHRRLFVSESVQ
ncbi:MAG TPA: group II intron reverse transcriptase/maturase [Gammaproteobacteria bacterium]|nr:group II intron reverse transcriptase/maturase [Gammaproteobacteria bacterium]